MYLCFVYAEGLAQSTVLGKKKMENLIPLTAERTKLLDD